MPGYRFALILIVGAGLCGVAHGACVDYDGYLHLQGAVATGAAHDIDIAGSYAFVTNGDTGVSAVDISDPQDPVLTGSVPWGDVCTGVDVAGDVAFVSTPCSISLTRRVPPSLERRRWGPMSTRAWRFPATSPALPPTRGYRSWTFPTRPIPRSKGP
jgi:hypothetical protein